MRKLPICLQNRGKLNLTPIRLPAIESMLVSSGFVHRSSYFSSCLVRVNYLQCLTIKVKENKDVNHLKWP